MTDELKKKLLAEFPGKMENEQAFIMQFIMKEAAKGNSPPSRDQIKQVINSMISEGLFDKKGDLLILKTSERIAVMDNNDDLEEEEGLTVFNPLEYTKSQQQILMAFQGKYENKSALIMNIIMKEVQEGNPPPSKDDLEVSIQGLLEKKILEQKDNVLIKKV